MPGMVKETKPGAAAAQDPVLCSKVPTLVSAFVDSFVDFVVGGQILGSPAASSLNQQASRRFTRVDEVHGSQGKQLQQQQQQQQNKKNKERGMLTTWLPAPERLIAIGDLHGDLSKTRAVLGVAQVIDENDHWIGGKTVVVQVGDLLDRGGEELKVIYLLEKLRLEAQRSGGNVHIMNGNHEIMNIEGDFRYVTLAGMHEFRTWAHWFNLGNLLKDRCGGLGKQPNLFHSIPASYPEGLRARMAALRPGGPISSRFLASHPTVLVVGSSVFVHGGLLPAHVDHGLDRINLEVRDWMLGGNGWRAPSYLHGADAVVWLRKYSDVKESQCDCELLHQSIASIPGVQRMVVGHTIQFPMGINSICNDAVIRVDVGLSKGCGDGEPQVLEIKRDRELRVLSAHSPTQFINAGSMVHRGMGIRGDDDKAHHPSLPVRNPKRGG